MYSIDEGGFHCTHKHMYVRRYTHTNIDTYTKVIAYVSNTVADPEWEGLQARCYITQSGRGFKREVLRTLSRVGGASSKRCYVHYPEWEGLQVRGVMYIIQSGRGFKQEVLRTLSRVGGASSERCYVHYPEWEGFKQEVLRTLSRVGGASSERCYVH